MSDAVPFDFASTPIACAGGAIVDFHAGRLAALPGGPSRARAPEDGRDEGRGVAGTGVGPARAAVREGA